MFTVPQRMGSYKRGVHEVRGRSCLQSGCKLWNQSLQRIGCFYVEAVGLKRLYAAKRYSLKEFCMNSLSKDMFGTTNHTSAT